MSFFGFFKKKTDTPPPLPRASSDYSLGQEPLQGPQPSPFLEPLDSSPLAPSAFSPAMQDVRGDKDFQLILSKLDVINSKLDLLNRRLEALERTNVQEQPPQSAFQRPARMW